MIKHRPMAESGLELEGPTWANVLILVVASDAGPEQAVDVEEVRRVVQDAIDEWWNRREEIRTGRHPHEIRIDE